MTTVLQAGTAEPLGNFSKATSDTISKTFSYLTLWNETVSIKISLAGTYRLSCENSDQNLHAQDPGFNHGYHTVSLQVNPAYLERKRKKEKERETEINKGWGLIA